MKKKFVCAFLMLLAIGLCPSISSGGDVLLNSGSTGCLDAEIGSEGCPDLASNVCPVSNICGAFGIACKDPVTNEWIFRDLFAYAGSETRVTKWSSPAPNAPGKCAMLVWTSVCYETRICTCWEDEEEPSCVTSTIVNRYILNEYKKDPECDCLGDAGLGSP